ncbi:MAG: hypothetical protein WCL27_18940 [Betaproteobacteria bacterium]
MAMRVAGQHERTGRKVVYRVLHALLKCVVLITALAAGISFAAPPESVELPVRIFDAEFGTFDASNPQEMVFEPTPIVPHRQGQRYGWIIEVRTARRSLSVIEEYLLPNPAKTLPATDNSTVVLDIPQHRRNQVSQRQLVPVDGMITGEWAIGPNEPAGHRVLQVLVEGQVAAVFEFDVK